MPINSLTFRSVFEKVLVLAVYIKVVSATFNKKVKSSKSLTECRYGYWKISGQTFETAYRLKFREKLDQIEKRNIREKGKN